MLKVKFSKTVTSFFMLIWNLLIWTMCVCMYSIYIYLLKKSFKNILFIIVTYILWLCMQNHTFRPDLISLTVRSMTFCWRVVLEDDWHEGLTYNSLPSFGKLSSHPTIGRNTTGASGDGQTRHTGWRGGVGVFTNKVDHGTRHDLKTVGACARRDEREITCRANLQDFWEWDLLRREAKGQITLSIMQTICTKVN